MPNVKDMTTSPAGLAAGQLREGFRARSYRCSRGRWTIGYGSTYRIIDGEVVPVGPGETITEREAAELFAVQWRIHEAGIARAITRELLQNQFDTLADMAFNLGPDFLFSGARGTTGLREAINAGAWEHVDGEILRWHWAGDRRDAGLYTRAISRLCQWHGLPFDWPYHETTEDTIKRDASGRVIETPFIRLNLDGTLGDMVTAETALARARAYDAKARAAAPPKARVPVDAAPPPKPPEPAPKAADPAPEVPVSPPPAPPPPPPKERKPIIAIGDPYKQAARSGLTVKDLHYRGLDPDAVANAKPITDSETFWGGVWLALGQILLQMGQRGFFIAVLPSWASVLLIDALRDPFVLGILATITAALVSAILSAPALIRAGWRKMKRGRANATQLKY